MYYAHYVPPFTSGLHKANKFLFLHASAQKAKEGLRERGDGRCMAIEQSLDKRVGSQWWARTEKRNKVKSSRNVCIFRCCIFPLSHSLSQYGQRQVFLCSYIHTTICTMTDPPFPNLSASSIVGRDIFSRLLLLLLRILIYMKRETLFRLCATCSSGQTRRVEAVAVACHRSAFLLLPPSF